MIHVNHRKITGVYGRRKEVSRIYKSLQLVWSKIAESSALSCFASGYWIDDYPWTDDEAWVD